MYITALVMVPSEEVGRRIALALLENRLASCINMGAGIRSFYWWDGRINDENELILMIKTRNDLFSEVEELVKRFHPYQVPEIVALPVIAGHRPYLEWISTETREPACDPGYREILF